MRDIVTVLEGECRDHIRCTECGACFSGPPVSTATHRLTRQISDILDGSTATGAVTDDDVTESVERLRQTSEFEVLVGITARVVDTDLVEGRRRRNVGDVESTGTRAGAVSGNADGYRLSSGHDAYINR